MKRPIWKLKESDPRATQVAQACGISSFLAQILLNRKVEPLDIPQFLNPSYLSGLHSPHLLPDIDKAVKMIKAVTKRGEKIMVIGDYDVDGITALAIFHEYIRDFPDTFIYSIPHRVKEGYGLNKEAVEKAKNEGARLLICFDCGTGAYDELLLARSYGIETIVVDHHIPKDTTPADAFVNPKRGDSQYPFRELSGAALSFKLLQALQDDPCSQVLDLVALSLVCDVVPLKGENRILVKEGIKFLKETKRPAIKALCAVSKIKQENIEHFHIGYILGPRLNASGRVSSAHEALDIFLTDDTKKIHDLVAKLQEYNQRRKLIEADILKQAESMIEREHCDEYAIVVHGDGWHPGVLGVVASRLADKYYRPSFVISFEENFGKGSARSIHSVHLMETLEKCSQFLHGYGGHKKAAGIQIFKEELVPFKEMMNSLIKEGVNPKDLVPILEIDLKINFSEISMAFIEELEMLTPHGEENPQVLFMSTYVKKKSEPRKTAYRHSLWLSEGDATFEAVVGDQDLLDLLRCANEFDIVYTIEKNNYHSTPRLIIKDVRLA